MADRQANINVNYNINTQSVQAAEQSLRKAQQASDSLNKSAGQVGTTFQKTNQQVLSNGQKIAATIDGQRVQMAQLRSQIELTRAADTKRLQQLTADYKTVKASVDSFNKSLQVQKTQTESLSQSFGGLITTVRAFIAAGIVKEVVETQLEMAKLAGKVEGVERAFARLPMSTQLLNDLRKATHGTVTDVELMQQALRANNFEIDLKKLGGLLEFAATRAQQTGQEVDYLVNSIVMGIGMKSILRLDNLGLSATRLKEELGGVSVKAASVAEITRVVAKVAEESQAKLGGYFETSATAVGKLQVAWNDLKVSLSQEWGNSELAKFMTEFLRTTLEIREANQRGISVAQVQAEHMQKEKALTADLTFAKDKLTGTIDENISAVEDEMKLFDKRVYDYDKEITSIQALIDLKKQQKEINQELYRKGDYDAGARNATLSKEIKDLEQQITDITMRGNVFNQERLKLLRERHAALLIEKEDASDIGKQLGIIEDLQDKIEAKEDLIKTATSINEIRKLQRELSELQKQLAIADASFNDFGSLAVGADKTIPGKQVAKIGAEVSSLTVPARTMSELIDYLNQRFKENPPEMVVVPAPDSQWKEAWDQFLEQDMPTLIATDIVSDQLKSVLFAEVDAYDQRIEAAEAFYDRQKELAGEKYSEQTEAEKARNKELQQIEDDRIKAVDRLRKQQAEKEIKARRLSIIIDTAAGIAKAFATAATIPQAVIQAAIVAAYGASNLAIVNRQRANFATGVIDLKGPGTETSDSIPANLSRGESVMTAKETRNSLGILKAIRAKRLDDRVLEQIKSGKSGGSQINAFNDQGIIKAIKENKNPDYIEKHGMLYRVHRRERNYLRIQRAKSMGE